MKNYSKIFVLIVAFLYAQNCWVYSQSKIERQQMKVIAEFYSSLNAVCSDNLKNQRVVKVSADSVMAKYCTQRIRLEAMQWLEQKNLNITDCWKLDVESLKKMTIEKDSTNPNTYHVNYQINTPSSSNTVETQNVKLIVVVKEEDKVFKIDEIR